MNTAGWIIVAVLVIPVIAVLAWIVIGSSVVRVPSGSLGFLMVKGRARNTALPPGPSRIRTAHRGRSVVRSGH